MSYDFGFTSALAVRLADGAAPDDATLQIQNLLDAQSPSEALVDVGCPSVSLERGWMWLPLRFRTRRGYKMSEAVDAAAAAIAQVNSNVKMLTAIDEAREDHAPSIASCGTMP